MNKLKNMEQLGRAIQMFAATLSEEQAMEIATVYPPWEPDKKYKMSDYITYGQNGVGDPQLYKVAQGHTSQADWTPDVTPALYVAIGLDDNGYPIWSQPTGAHDAYNIDDIVDHEGTLYISKIDGNTYVPGTDERWWEVYNG